MAIDSASPVAYTCTKENTIEDLWLIGQKPTIPNGQPVATITKHKFNQSISVNFVPNVQYECRLHKIFKVFTGQQGSPQKFLKA